MFASYMGHCSTVKLLGNKGASLDLQDGQGDTALANAAANFTSAEIVASFQFGGIFGNRIA